MALGFMGAFVAYILGYYLSRSLYRKLSITFFCEAKIASFHEANLLSLMSLSTHGGHPSHLLGYPLHGVMFASQKKVIDI